MNFLLKKEQSKENPMPNDAIEAKTIYYAGEVEAKEEASEKTAKWLVAYKRHFNFENKVVNETCHALIDGEYFQETYNFDHKSNTLICHDANKNEMSKTQFKSQGNFPDLTACTYNLDGQKYKMTGNDSYHGEYMELNSLNVDLTTKQATHIRGKLPTSTAENFKERLNEIEKLSSN